MYQDFTNIATAAEDIEKHENKKNVTGTVNSLYRWPLCEVHLASMVDFLEYIAIGQGN